MIRLSPKSLWGLLTTLSLVVLLAACAPAADTADPMAGAITGPAVGNVSPEFTMARPDGEKITLSHLDAGDQPAHLFFFASW